MKNLTTVFFIFMSITSHAELAKKEGELNLSNKEQKNSVSKLIGKTDQLILNIDEILINGDVTQDMTDATLRDVKASLLEVKQRLAGTPASELDFGDFEEVCY
jgi:hypothetical protein